MVKEEEEDKKGSSPSPPIRLLGVEFAPLSIPWERRMQTLAVVVYMFLFLFFSTCVVVTMALLLFTPFMWLPLLYTAWILYDKDVGNTGGRDFSYCWVRKWRLWRYHASFFPINLIKTAELDPSKTYLLGCHPHGVLCYGVFCAFATDALDVMEVFPGLLPRLLTLAANFRLPGGRELIAGTGACAATREGMETLLREPEGTAAVLIVGGATEALNYDPKTIKLVLNRRKGFVKLALRFGRDLVPVFSFGENYVYGQVENPEGSWLRTFQEQFERYLSFSPPIFYGRGIFQYSWGLVPFRKPINVVVGKPISVAKVADPTKEDVERLHADYVRALQDLYEEYNPKYGDPDVKLVIG